MHGTKQKRNILNTNLFTSQPFILILYLNIDLGGGNDKGSLLKNLKNKNLKNLSDTTIQIQPLLTIHLLFHHAYLEVHMFIIS